MLSLIGTITAGLGFLNRKQKQIKRLGRAVSSSISTIDEIKNKAKAGKITVEEINSIAKTTQEAFNIRDEVRSMVKDFMAKKSANPIVSGGKL